MGVAEMFFAKPSYDHDNIHNSLIDIGIIDLKGRKYPNGIGKYSHEDRGCPSAKRHVIGEKFLDFIYELDSR